MSAKGLPFVLEIGVEPMPARFIAPALAQLQEKLEAVLRESRLEFGSVRTCGTPRRLTAFVEALEPKSPPLTREVSGPPARLLKAEDGSYTPQAEGFARKHGLNPQDLLVIGSPKGELLAARFTEPGELASRILGRALPPLISSLQFPKTLEWEPSRLRFGRPIRGLICLHGSKLVPVSVAGVKSGRALSGLPALGRKPSSLADAGRYEKSLRDLGVVADVEERRRLLVGRLETAARKCGGTLDLDPALVDETLYMTEQPIAVLGSFKEDHLALPSALLSLVLKKQLKFFPLLKGGSLLARFIGVRDGSSEGEAQVREGYQRVLAARLADAAFFISRDAKRTLRERLPELERVTYEAKLGSVSARAARVRALAEALASEAGADSSAAAQAAELCFADLVSEVVKEFPELQGIIGGVYARKEGLPEAVARALEEFYFPIASGGPVPSTREAAVVSLAGKLDALAGHFLLGRAPTGSADPFALRRAATGAARIALEADLPVDLEAALARAVSLQPVQGDDALLRSLAEFIWTRVQTLLEEQGFKIDEIRSVKTGALKDLPRALRRLRAVASVRRDPEFEQLSAAFKRASNILRQAGANGFGEPDPARLREDAERALLEALIGVERGWQATLAQGFEEGLKSLVVLKPHVDLFFDKVMVMAEDPELRRQRLALLSKMVRLFNSVADLSQLQTPG